MEWRNFASVVPAAKKSQLGPIFFQNIRVIYKLSVKKQETGQKTGKKPPKKGVFIRPSDQLAEFGLKSWQLLAPNSASWSEGLMKTPFFGGFLHVFCPVSCFFTDNLCMKCLFCKKKSSHLTFSSRRSASYKVPPRIGGHHFLLCQQTNTKDIAGQSAKSGGDVENMIATVQDLLRPA